MHHRTSLAPLFGALLWAAPGLLLQASPVLAQTAAQNFPQTATVTALRGNTVTLSIGSDDRAQIGAVYEVRRGQTFARLQITKVEATQSLATIQSSSPDFVITVGDTAAFAALETLPVAPSPLEPEPAPIPTVAPTPTPISGVVETTPSQNPATVIPSPSSAITGSTATVLSVQGSAISVSAGFAQGAKSGQTVPILRAGQVVGLAKLGVVSENESSASVLFVDDTAGTIRPGDAVGILGASPTIGVPSLQTPDAVPSAPTRYETGASNVSVPKSERAYELLAALATSGLIKSQPARIFHDDGARRHNTNEDIIFSRAQIAGFIREAIGNSGDANSRDKTALQLLVKEFRRDLEKSGTSASELEAFKAQGASLGVLTWSRATVTGGSDGDKAIDPFSDEYGQRRSKSGFDTRISAFGNLTENLEFYATVDTGSDIRSENDPRASVGRRNEPGTEIRNLYLKYDATKLLRGLSIELGRREQWWGTGQFGTTLLGDASGGLDSMRTHFKRGSYELRGLYARLGKGPAGGARSLYGQSAILNIGQGARVGINTTILSPKDGFDPKLFLVAFTPFSLYIADREKSDENGGRDNTNAVVNAFGEVAIARGARVYGEIVLDDISLNSNNNVENRNGSLVGVHLFNPKNPAKAGFKAEYARLNAQSYLYLNLVGSRQDADYTFYYRGAPLGYPVAPRLVDANNLGRLGGAESLRFEAYYQPTKRLSLIGGLEFSDINTEDQGPGRILGGGARGFSRQQVYRASATYDLTGNWSLTARVQRIATDQPNFVVFEQGNKGRFYALEIARSF